MDKLPAAHEPYSALLMGPDSVVISAIRGADRVFGTALAGLNIFDWMFATGDPNDRISNWPDVANAALARLRADAARSPHNERLQTTLKNFKVPAKPPLPAFDNASQLVVCPGSGPVIGSCGRSPS